MSARAVFKQNHLTLTVRVGNHLVETVEHDPHCVSTWPVITHDSPSQDPAATADCRSTTTAGWHGDANFNTASTASWIDDDQHNLVTLARLAGKQLGMMRVRDTILGAQIDRVTLLSRHGCFLVGGFAGAVGCNHQAQTCNEYDSNSTKAEHGVGLRVIC